MSFVNAVYLDRFISIVSDGKITDIENDRNDDIKKFVKHHNNFFVAVTGYLDIWIAVRDTINAAVGLNVKQAKELVVDDFESLKHHRATNGSIVSASAMIVGFENKMFYGFNVRMAEGKVFVSKVEFGGTTSLDPQLDFDTASEIADEISIISRPLTINKIQRIQRKELKRVASISASVNDNVFQEVIYNE